MLKYLELFENALDPIHIRISTFSSDKLIQQKQIEDQLKTELQKFNLFVFGNPNINVQDRFQVVLTLTTSSNTNDILSEENSLSFFLTYNMSNLRTQIEAGSATYQRV